MNPPRVLIYVFFHAHANAARNRFDDPHREVVALYVSIPVHTSVWPKFPTFIGALLSAVTLEDETVTVVISRKLS